MTCQREGKVSMYEETAALGLPGGSFFVGVKREDTP